MISHVWLSVVEQVRPRVGHLSEQPAEGQSLLSASHHTRQLRDSLSSHSQWHLVKLQKVNCIIPCESCETECFYGDSYGKAVGWPQSRLPLSQDDCGDFCC